MYHRSLRNASIWETISGSNQFLANVRMTVIIEEHAKFRCEWRKAFSRCLEEWQYLLHRRAFCAPYQSSTIVAGAILAAQSSWHEILARTAGRKYTTRKRGVRQSVCLVNDAKWSCDGSHAVPRRAAGSRARKILYARTRPTRRRASTLIVAVLTPRAFYSGFRWNRFAMSKEITFYLCNIFWETRRNFYAERFNAWEIWFLYIKLQRDGERERERDNKIIQDTVTTMKIN